MLTVYARREPTTDSTSIMLGLGHPNATVDPTLSDQEMLSKGLFGKLDVAIYRDEAMTLPFARFCWDRSNKPKLNQKRVTLNCYEWAIQWMPDHLPRQWDSEAFRTSLCASSSPAQSTGSHL